VVTVWLAEVAHAGVWVRDQGDTWLQIGVQHSESTRAFDGEGVLREQSDETFLGVPGGLYDGAQTAITDLTLYGELGLGHGFELDMALPVRYATNRFAFAEGDAPDVRNAHAGLSDLMVAGRFGTVRGGWAASVLAGVRLPLYDNAPEALRIEPGNADFYDDRSPLGNGTIDVDLSVGGGTSWSWGWALLEAGGRVRNRLYSAALPGRLQVGVKPVEPLAVWVSADSQLSLGNGDAPDFYVDEWGKGPSVVDNQSFLGASAGLSVDANETLALYATASRVVTAIRYPLLTTFSGGVVVHFDVRNHRPTPVQAEDPT
jgi:hypothetical protein